jgi:diguanylate cyclase (GGDEF)-like protein
MPKGANKHVPTREALQQQTMETLLSHLVEITGHRDHTLLDVSVLSALHQLVGAKEVRTYEIFRFRDELFLRQRAVVRNGKVTPVDEPSDADLIGEPISNFPQLIWCMQNRATSKEEITADGQHVLWFPIWLSDKVGTCLMISQPQAFTDESLKLIEGVLSVYRNYQSLLDYSERDSLTGLLNRKTFDENFSRMVSGAHGHESVPHDPPDRRLLPPTKEQWLGVVDIDHFKRVNDQFGHLYGDEVLILVANILRASFRAQDRVFRFGGEEFVILLRSVTLEDARKIFERFRANVEEHVFPQVGQVTVSVGFSSITSETPVVILGHADQALYYAKANGRNQVCYYDELVQSGLLSSEVSNDSVEFFFDDVATGSQTD